MSRVHTRWLVAITGFAAAGLMVASALPAQAAPQQTGSCPIKGGRAPCDWVEECLKSGGTPERKPFSGKLLCCFSKNYCEGMPEPVPDIKVTPPQGKKLQQMQPTPRKAQ